MTDSGKFNFTSVAPASAEGNIENNDAQELLKMKFMPDVAEGANDSP